MDPHNIEALCRISDILKKQGKHHESIKHLKVAKDNITTDK